MLADERFDEQSVVTALAFADTIIKAEAMMSDEISLIGEVDVFMSVY